MKAKNRSYVWGIMGLIVVLGALVWLGMRFDWGEFLRFDKMDRLTYLNQVVERVNTTLGYMEKNFDEYENSIPAKMTVDTEVKVNDMRRSFLVLQEYLPRLMEVKTLNCREAELKEQVDALFEDYYPATRDHLDLTSEMISFYAQQGYGDEPDKVAQYDEDFKKSYYHFIQEHNHLTTFLNSVGEEF